MTAMDDYSDAIVSLIKEIAESQKKSMSQAARMIADAVERDGIVYTFGTGHSHIIAEDVAYRAGGLVPVDAILEPSLTGHQQVHKSETMERVEGVAEVIFDYYGISEKDIMIVISNSGRNAAPIEMAQICQKHNVPVIAITSLQYSKSVSSRHSSGTKLYEHADVVIDNRGPLGDTLLELEGVSQPVGPGSGVTGLYILHSIIVQSIKNLADDGFDPPVFRSGNLDGSDEINKELLKRYQGRIKLW